MQDESPRQRVGNHTDLLSGRPAQQCEEPALRLEECHQKPQRILVVEDDSTLATLEAGILTAYGYLVVAVNSGELAISTFRSSLPDLVLLDLELTGSVHGWDVLQALRITARTPVILTTGSRITVREQMRSRGETRLTLDHLPKPYPMQLLLKRVQRMLMIAPP